MSDIEDDMEWEEDEEDMLFIDDGDPELADELVLGTTHSPVYIGEIALEAALAADSDCDEFEEDEYFDQDTAAWKKGREFVNTPGNSALKRKYEKRGREQKRRKLERDGNHGAVDPTTFAGVIWRTTAHTAMQERVYEPGQENGVALLRNWRQIGFKEPGQCLPMTRQYIHPADSKSQQEVEDEDWTVLRDVSPTGLNDKSNNNIQRTLQPGDFTILNKESENYQPPPTSLFPMNAQAPKSKQRMENRFAAYKSRTSSRLKQVVSAEDVRTPEPPEPPVDQSPEPKRSTSEYRSSPMDIDAQPEEPAPQGKKRKAQESASEYSEDTTGEGQTAKTTTGSRKRSKRSEKLPSEDSPRRSSRLQRKT